MKPKDISVQAVGLACGYHSCSTEPAGHETCADLARRGFLRDAIGSTVVVLAGATVTRSRPASAQSTLTPDAALKALMDGNQRSVGGQPRPFNEDLSLLKAKSAEKQEPFAAVLSCADSRVPGELVFGQSIGQLFVVRVAGNVTRPEITASLEYGVAFLGTKVVTVLGHGNCGVVNATIEARRCLGRSAPSTAPSGWRWTPRTRS